MLHTFLTCTPWLSFVYGPRHPNIEWRRVHRMMNQLPSHFIINRQIYTHIIRHIILLYQGTLRAIMQPLELLVTVHAQSVIAASEPQSHEKRIHLYGIAAS